MTISYNWLCDYLPLKPAPEELSGILTSLGLEVESMELFESIPGGLKGLVVGEVLEAKRHPGADKLSLTLVNVGDATPLQIVCGAPNVAAGQKVIVAKVGTTIHPVKGEPVTMKVAKIRGEKSEGMLCAADEVGLGDSHAGIVILPDDLEPGTPVADHFKPYQDYVYEIGLTPNRVDAMSHLGVARDVCAYLSHHRGEKFSVVMPELPALSAAAGKIKIEAEVLDKTACERYSGIAIGNLKSGPSPEWMQHRLLAVGVRPINNIVDITNFVLQEMGQPLHAYDADQIAGNKVVVKRLPEGTPFVTLDEKERRLSAEDLMICDAEKPLCLAGVFGGLHSGVSAQTKTIFLEAAWFNPAVIRRTSFRHGLRTEAAIHFEKGMDISQTVPALERAVSLIREYAGGEPVSGLVDVYPTPRKRAEVSVSFRYLRMISGKQYTEENIISILSGLGFDLLSRDADELRLAVPFHKTDVSLPADIAEEIMRVDGYDHIAIPSAIRMSPSVETGREAAAFREKSAETLAGLGFHEIFTNSITNAAYYTEAELTGSVRMINSLSAELNVMRPSLLETGLETVAYNVNRKNADLLLFEFGKTYHSRAVGQYEEKNHLCLYVSGQLRPDSWKGKGQPADIYFVKGVVERLLAGLGISLSWQPAEAGKLDIALRGMAGKQILLKTGSVRADLLRRFDIRQSVYFTDIDWDEAEALAQRKAIRFDEIPRQLPVYRDLALVVDKGLAYSELENVVRQIRLDKLRELRLFDIFESDKIGQDKKSMALSFTFMDSEKTLTDKEIDAMMSKIIQSFEKVGAEIRK